MQLIYPVKIVQAVVTIVCVLTLIGGRDLCSERGFEEEMRTVVSSLKPSCQTAKLLQIFGRNLTVGNETKEIWHLRCLSLEWKDLFVGSPSQIHVLRPSTTALFLMLLVIVLEVELIYVYWGQSKEELSTKGALLLGLIHLGLVLAAGFSLFMFRHDWSSNWPEGLLMDYPTDWHRMELLLVVMALGYAMEVVYSRGLRSRLVFFSYDEKSYRVAEQEQKNGYGRI